MFRDARRELDMDRANFPGRGRSIGAALTGGTVGLKIGLTPARVAGQ
jgi:hypothetical protein